jgi:SAM-dependent methyltransferase
MTISPADVQSFLDTSKFSGYQSVPLPFGMRVPGKDRSKTADILLGDRVRGKSVLDVGTYYGFFPNDAVRRGATRAVGIEADPERFAIARRIAEFNGGYEIRHARAEELALDERFDVVLFLNVIHHVKDPIEVMTRLAAHTRETMIVEFCLPDDPQYLDELYRGRSTLGRTLSTGVRAAAMRLLGDQLPLMAVGNREYHRIFYFSRQAFTNLFVVHLGLFSHVEFLPPLSKRRRAVAVCTVKK